MNDTVDGAFAHRRPYFKRRSSFLTVCLWICLPAASFAAEEPEEPKKPEEPTIEAVIPRTSAAAAVIPDLAAFWADLRRSRWAGMFAEPEMQIFLRPILERLQTNYESLRRRNPHIPSWLQLNAALFTGELAVFQLPNSADVVSPSAWAFYFKPADAPAFAAVMTQMLGANALKNDRVVEVEGYGGLIWTDGRLLFTQPASALPLLLKRLESAADGVGADGLSADAQYREIRKLLPNGRAFFFLNFKRLIETISQSAANLPSVPAQEKLLAVLGLNNFQSFGAAVGLHDDEPVLEAVLRAARPAQSQPLFDLLLGDPLPPEAFALADPDAPFVAGFRFDALGFLRLLENLAEAAQAGGGIQLTAALAYLRAELGFDVRKDLLENLRSEIVISQPSADCSAPPFLSPGMVVSIMIKDQAKIAECLRLFFLRAQRPPGANDAPASIRYRTFQHDGHALYYFSAKWWGPDAVLAVLKDRLVLATTLSAMRFALAQFERKRTILDNPEFMRAVSRAVAGADDANRLPPLFACQADRNAGRAEFLLTAWALGLGTLALCTAEDYGADPRAVAEAVNRRVAPPLSGGFDWFARGPAGVAAMDVLESVDLGLWPGQEFFAKRRRAKVGVIFRRPEGVFLRWALPPPLPAVEAGPSWLTLFLAAGSGAAAAAPLSNKVQVAFQLRKRADNLRTIGAALRAFAESSEDKKTFPAEAAELYPDRLADWNVFVNPEMKDQPVGYVYVAGLRADQSERVLMFETVDREKSQGRFVLAVSGKVAWLTNAEFEKRIGEIEAEARSADQPLRFVPIPAKPPAKREKINERSR
jgi:hypothetical protein